MIRFPVRAFAASALLAALFAASGVQARARRVHAKAASVVVELFTAQGCAACPQANALLQELAGRKGVVALTLPVDYWDYLGWPDSFAKPDFTARQRAYVARLKLREVYTPEIVVGGRREAPGFDREKVQALIAADAPPRRTPTVRFVSDTRVQVSAGAGAGEVWLARYDPVEKTVKVTAGENRGKTVVQQNVVRELVKLGTWSGSDRRFPLPPASDPALKSVVLVQGPRATGVVAVGVR